MAKRRTTLKCPICKIEVKASRLDIHIGKVHPGQSARSSGSGRLARKGNLPLVMTAVACIVVLLVAGVGIYYLNRPSEEAGVPSENPPTASPTAPTSYARIETERGTFVAELYGNGAPNTVSNFKALADMNYFEGTIFHRVIANFVVQGGGFMPNLDQKTVPFAAIKLETNPKLKNVRGTLAMARTKDVDSATTQFYINLKDNTDLNPSSTSAGYAVFGKIIRGMEFVDAIGSTPTTTKNTPQGVPMEDVPVSPILLHRITIMDTPDG